MRNLVRGATVNDVALAVIGGALRTYLEDAGELPTASLRAMTPVSVRTESEKSDLGNQVSAMIVSLATDVADPVERLAAVQRSTASSKEVTQAVGRPQPVRAVAIGAGTADRCRHQAGGQVHPARVGRSGQHGRDQRAWST